MKNPLVSIIIPAYNAENFLVECLDSILNQSYPHWELIAINDFSNDNSKTILNSYAHKDKRITIIDNNSKGIIPALKLGYKHSKGDYITRMDADDIMPLDKINNLLSLLLSKGDGYIATGCVEYFSETPLGNGYKRYAQWLNDFTLKSNHFTDRYKECVIASPAWMISRKDFEDSGAFNSSLYPEDYDLVFRFYKNNLKIVSTSSVVHLWRDHGTRASRNDPNYLDNNFFDLKVKYFIELDLNPQTELHLLGAGKKAKAIAKRLNANNIQYNWYSNNVKKIGKDIYGTIILNQKELPKEGQNIVVISNITEQNEICSNLESHGLIRGKHYFVFV